MLGVLWCFASSLHLASWQQRHLALCGVLCYPSTPCVVVLCTPALRYSSLDDPGLPLDTAKLHTRHSLQHVWHTLLLSSSAFPAPSLPPPFLVVCVCVRWGSVVFFPFVQFPLPSLRREKSGAQLVARVFSGEPT